MTSTLGPDSTQLIEELLADANRYGLVLFVGSGVNVGILPQWDKLLTTLLKQAIEGADFQDHRTEDIAVALRDWCKSHFDVCAQASLVKHILGPERYRLEIQDALYRGGGGVERNASELCEDVEKSVRDYCTDRRRNVAKVDPNYELLWRVAELSGLPQVRAVATFNFDPLLEYAISACGDKTPQAYFGGQTIPFGEATSVSGRILPVFHVHGLLSPPEALFPSPQESVVLSYDEFFDKNADPLSWETATPLHLLRSFCSLWLGASLKDWNMMRLLHAARSGIGKMHSYALQCLDEAKADALPSAPSDRDKAHRLREIAMRFQATLYDAVGVHLIIAGSEYRDIPATIDHHITRRLRESQGSQFGGH